MLTSEQLDQWRAFYELEPWGSDWQNCLTASVSRTFTNVMRGGRHKLADFKLVPPGERSTAAMRQRLKAGFVAMGMNAKPKRRA